MWQDEQLFVEQSGLASSFAVSSFLLSVIALRASACDVVAQDKQTQHRRAIQCTSRPTLQTRDTSEELMVISRKQTTGIQYLNICAVA